MLLKCRNHKFQNTTALYHHSPEQLYIIVISSTIPRSTKPIYKPSVTSFPVVKVSAGVRPCLEWNFLMALMNQVPDPRDQTFTISDQVISKKEEQHLQQSWERCLNNDAVVIPHRIIRLYDQKGDCTRIIHTNVFHREDDESDADSTPIQESTYADDAADMECKEEYPDLANQGEGGEKSMRMKVKKRYM